MGPRGNLFGLCDDLVDGKAVLGWLVLRGLLIAPSLENNGVCWKRLFGGILVRNFVYILWEEDVLSLPEIRIRWDSCPIQGYTLGRGNVFPADNGYLLGQPSLSITNSTLI